MPKTNEAFYIFGEKMSAFTLAKYPGKAVLLSVTSVRLLKEGTRQVANRPEIIELNGKHYDARTGIEVTRVANNHPKKTATKHVDGFVRRKPSTLPAKAARKQQAVPVGTVHRSTERSAALMRTAVTQPQKHQIHAKAAPKATTQKVATESPKPQVGVNKGRLYRAHTVSQSAQISKFGTDAPIQASIKTAVVPVKEAPAPQTPTTTHQTTVKATPAPANSSQHAIDRALAMADSHFQPQVRKVSLPNRVAKKLRVSAKTLQLASGSMALIALVAIIGYQHIPTLSLQIATTRSGVNASLPTYQPSGYRLNNVIAAAPGEVTMQYESNTDDRNFSIVQRSTDWNSQTLLDNFVTQEDSNYQLLQANGRTVYLYGDNATWVDGGVWYQVSGDAALNRDQIIRIVEGL